MNDSTNASRLRVSLSPHRALPLVTALALMLSGPAWAGDVCVLSNAAGQQVVTSTASGDNALACGRLNQADGRESSTFGRNNFAVGDWSSAFGFRNGAYADGSSAFGYQSFAYDNSSVAIGVGSRAGTSGSNISTGHNSAAMGTWYDAAGDGSLEGLVGNLTMGNTASGRHSSAFGVGNTATGNDSSAFGLINNADGRQSSAFGAGNTATGVQSSALGSANRALGFWSTAVGRDNHAYANAASAFGWRNHAAGQNSSAIGSDNRVSGNQSGAFGFGNTVSGAGSQAFGSRAVIGTRVLDEADNPVLDANGNPAYAPAAAAIAISASTGNAEVTTIGAGADHAIAIGSSVTIVENAADAVAIGRGSRAHAAGAVAIGAASIADRAGSVSFGSDGAERQLVHVADGIEETDAINLRQLRAASMGVSDELVAWFGGGAAHANGAFTAPVYVIQSNNYSTVGSAFGAVDAALTDINQRIADAGGVQGERGYSAYEVAVQNGYAGSEAQWLSSLQGPAGPTGPQGPEGPDGGGPRSVSYDNDERDTLTLAGAEGTRIANVADGVAATDAVNVRQMQAGDAATLDAANTYTDTVAVQTLQSANAYTDSRFAAWDAQLESIQRGIDDRFRHQDRRIDRMAAMAGAYAGMAMNTAGLAGRNRIGVGIGGQNGEQALAIGYQRALGTHASVSLGGAFGGGERSLMGGAGFSW